MKTWTKIEPELGEVFEYIGVKAKCVEDDPHESRNCKMCAFYGSLRCDTICCAAHEREDDRDVHFIRLYKP